MKKLNNKLLCNNSSHSLINSAITLRTLSFSILGTLLSTAFINISVNSTEIDDDREGMLPSSAALPPQNDQLQRADLIGKYNEEDFLFKKRRKRIENQFSLLSEKTKASKKNPTYQESDFNWGKIGKAILLVFLGVALFLGQTSNFNQSILPQVSAYEEASILADGKIGVIPHMRRSNIDKRVSIAVIGGGYTGTMLSALLANMENQQGNSAFDIHLFERDLNFMNGASIVPARLHLGGEYPKDPKTARQCLRSAIIFKQMFQTETILTSRKRIDFLVAKVSTKKLQDDPESLVLKHLHEHYRDLQEHYKRTFNYFSQKWGNETTAHLLFGTPDDEFLTLLNSPNDIDDKRLHFHFTGGLKTSERGLQPIALGVILERLLSKNNVHLHLGETIVKSELTNNGYTLESYFENGGITQEYFASYVVNAAWHDVPYLNHQASLYSKFSSFSPDPPTKVYIRSIGLFDVSKCEKLTDDRSYFGLVGTAGGMVSFFSPTVAAIYSPLENLSYQGRYDLHHQVGAKTFLSKTAQDLLRYLNNNSNADYIPVLNEILSDAERKYPFLKGAEGITLLTRTSVSWDDEIYQRKHIKPTWPFGNNTPWIQAYATKATFSPLIALQITGQLTQQENIREKINLSESTKYFLQRLANEDFGEEQFLPEIMRLPEEFALITESVNAKDSTFLAEMQLYALRRQLPFAMIEALDKTETTILSQEQVQLLDIANLRTVDLRSIPSTGEFTKALTEKIKSLPRTHKGFDSFRFQYHSSHGLGVLKALAGRHIKELEIDQLSLNTEDEVDSFIQILTRCKLENLVLRRFSADNSKAFVNSNRFLLELDRARSLVDAQIHFENTPTWKVYQLFLQAFQNVKSLNNFVFSNNHLGSILPKGPDSIQYNFSPLINFIERSNVQIFDLSYNQLFSPEQNFLKYDFLNAVCKKMGLVVKIRHNKLSADEEENWSSSSLLEQQFKCAEERETEGRAKRKQKKADQSEVREKIETVMMVKSQAMRSVTTKLDDEKIKTEKLTNDLEVLQQDDTLTQILRALGYPEDAPPCSSLNESNRFFQSI